MTYQPHMPEELSTRQWSFNVRQYARPHCAASYTTQAFEWVVRDVHRLRDFVESAEAPGDVPPESDEAEGSPPETDEFEILKETPIIGDGKFKLEIGTSVDRPSWTDHSYDISS